MTTIAIDLDRVLEQVFALCALRQIMQPDPGQRVACTDDRPALIHTALTKCADLLCSLGGYVLGNNIGSLPGEGGDTVVTIDIALNEARLAEVIRPVFENTLVNGIMAQLYLSGDSTASEEYAKIAAGTLAAIKTTLAMYRDKPGYITPAG